MADERLLDVNDINHEIVGPRARYVMQQLADAGIEPDFDTYAALVYVMLTNLKSQLRVPEGKHAPIDALRLASTIMGIACSMVDWQDASGPSHTFMVAKKN